MKREILFQLDIAWQLFEYHCHKEDAAAMLAQDTGVLCAATAFGKTAVGAYLVAQRKINTLVLVHNAEIMKNQLKAFEKFLQID